MTTHEPANIIEAVQHSTRCLKNVLVGGWNIECMRFGKVVHIQTIRRIPKIHNDGRVTIRNYGEDHEIFATKHTIPDGRFFFTFDVR